MDWGAQAHGKALGSIRQLDMDMRARAKRVLPQESRLPAVWC
jgi:hypothetical protein